LLVLLVGLNDASFVSQRAEAESRPFQSADAVCSQGFFDPTFQPSLQPLSLNPLPTLFFSLSPPHFLAMLLFSDIVTNDELFSDAYDVIEGNEGITEVDCQMITIKEGDVDIG
jgi:hypothetical protein